MLSIQSKLTNAFQLPMRFFSTQPQQVPPVHQRRQELPAKLHLSAGGSYERDNSASPLPES